MRWACARQGTGFRPAGRPANGTKHKGLAKDTRDCPRAPAFPGIRLHGPLRERGALRGYFGQAGLAFREAFVADRLTLELTLTAPDTVMAVPLHVTEPGAWRVVRCG